MKILKSILLLAILSQLTLARGIYPQQKESEKPYFIRPVSMVRAGEVVSLDEGGIQFTSPEGWQVERREDGDVFVSTSDGGLIVIFGIVDEDGIDERVEGLKSSMTERVRNFKSNGEPLEATLNGLKTIGETGSGEVEGEPVEWSIDVILARKPVLVYSFASKTVWHEHAADYESLIKSIKRIN